MIFAFGKIADKRDDERQRKESSNADEFPLAVIDHSHEAVPPIEEHHPDTNPARSSIQLECRPTKVSVIVCIVSHSLGLAIGIIVFMSLQTKT